MPSKSALEVIGRAQEWLDRALTTEEQYQCEELILNYYTRSVVRFVSGFIKKSTPQDFRLLYHPVMNGMLRGAYRRHDIIYMKDRMKEVYDKIQTFVGDGMSDKELESVIFMADDCTDKEIDSAIVASRVKGVHHAGYVRAIIEGNRRAATKHIKAVNPNRKKFVPPSYLAPAEGTVPRVDAIRDSWRNRVRSAKSKIEETNAELNAKKKVDKRGKKK